MKLLSSSNTWSDFRIDLTPFEEMFNMPKIPIWCQNLPKNTLGQFHPVGCDCGKPYGISIDLNHIRAAGEDPNLVILHEAMHALCYHLDPEAMKEDHAREQVLDYIIGGKYGYRNSVAEKLANEGAEYLHRRGMRVWHPTAWTEANDERLAA